MHFTRSLIVILKPVLSNTAFKSTKVNCIFAPICIHVHTTSAQQAGKNTCLGVWDCQVPGNSELRLSSLELITAADIVKTALSEGGKSSRQVSVQ